MADVPLVVELSSTNAYGHIAMQQGIYERFRWNDAMKKIIIMCFPFHISRKGMNRPWYGTA